MKGLDRDRIAGTQQAGEQRLEADGGSLAHGDKLDAHTYAGSDVFHQSRAADFAFGNGEQERDRSAGGWGIGSVDEQAADIQIANARDVLLAAVLPGNPDAFRRGYPRVAAITLGVIERHD
jgi:hypothetical protein